MGEVPEVAAELVPERQIQVVLFVELRNGDRLGPRAENGARLTPGNEVDQHEHDGDHPDDDHHGLQEPADEEAGHGAMLRTLHHAHPVTGPIPVR